jgi:hypothetical protein
MGSVNKSNKDEGRKMKPRAAVPRVKAGRRQSALRKKVK